MLTHGCTTPTLPGRVVVIGAAGFVGGAVARRLRAAGANVSLVGRADVDLLDAGAPEALARLLHPGDAIVFASARAPCRDVDSMIENMILLRSVIAAFDRVAPSHVVNVSSDAVYGDEEVPITEAMAPAPTSMHGAMHLARELALGKALDGRLATVRPTLIYGPGDPHNGYGPNRFGRLAARGEEIILFGEGEERRDHVFIEDVADLVARMILHRSTGVLNAATGEVHSFRAVADGAVASAGSGSPIRGTPRTGPMPHNGYRAFDPAATYAAFPGFRYLGLADGLTRAAEGRRNG